MVSTILVNSYAFPLPIEWPKIEEFTSVDQTVVDWEDGNAWNNAWGWGWKPDGTKFVTVTNSGDRMYGFDFSVPFDFNTTSHNSANPGQAVTVVGLDVMFNEDGTKYTRFSWYQNNALDAFNAATPYEPRTTDTSIGTINLGGHSSSDTFGYWIDATGEHLMLHTQGNSPDKILHFIMSTPWDPSTAVLQADEFERPASSGRMMMSPDGLDLLVSGPVKVIYHYRLTSPYNLDTMSEYSTLAHNNTSNGSFIWMSSDGEKLIIGPGQNGSYDIQIRTRV